ncbi:MAG: NUDIX domain-containing protein [Patescibacteria group bacterium]|jgi:8-oxo-dGTP diphosphatase
MAKPGAKVFVIFEKKFVLVQRDNNPNIPYPNCWNMPGGGIEENESALNAAFRELKEELDIVPGKLESIGIDVYTDRKVVHRFAAHLNKTEYSQVRLASEGQRLDWFTFDDALKLNLSPHFRAYLEQCSDHVREVLSGNVTAKNATIEL